MNTRKSTLRLALASLALIGWASSYAGQQLANDIPIYTAVYRVEHDNHSAGESTVSISFDEQSRLYRYRSETRMSGAYKLLIPQTIVSQSEFAIQDGIVTPLRYTQNEGKRGAADETITFDWDSGTAQSVTSQFDLRSNVLDPASLNVATMLDLLLNRPVESYAILDEDGIETYPVDVGSLEPFDHPLATAGAIRVSHAQPGSSRRTTTWAIPALCYLPAQIEQDNGDSSTRLVLDRVESKAGSGLECHPDL